MEKSKAAEALYGGHWFDMGATRRNLMHFISMLAGCEFVMKQAALEGRNIEGWPKRSHPLEELYDDCFTSEASRLLIEVAVTIRMLDDMAGSHVVNVAANVGSIRTGEDLRPLTLREACNKIIHASQVSFNLGGGVTTYVNREGEEVGECISYALPDALELRGERGGLSWSAELDIVAFVKVAAVVTYRYEDALDELYEHRHEAWEARRAEAASITSGS